MKHVAEFLNELSMNEGLKKELGECVAKADTSDGKVKLAVQFATDAGYDVSEEELALIVEKVNVKTELSDDELDSVAGGTDFGPTVPYEKGTWSLTNYASDNLETGISNPVQIGDDVIVGVAAVADVAIAGVVGVVQGGVAAVNFIGDIFSGW
jgi:hypothetical protein